jgi:coenzyme Q-binding protein COQ10
MRHLLEGSIYPVLPYKALWHALSEPPKRPGGLIPHGRERDILRSAGKGSPLPFVAWASCRHGVSHKLWYSCVPPFGGGLPEEEVTMGHLKQSVHISAPVDRVVKYSEDPNNWHTFMVGMSEPDRITGDIGAVGTQVEFKISMAGVHMQETCRTTEDRHDPDGAGHWRGEFAGSMSGWMTMDFKPENGGALVTQEMEYTAPGGVLGKVADRLVFEKKQEGDMLQSLENLKLLMEKSPA